MVLRPTWSLVALFAIGFVVIFGYACVTRTGVASSVPVGDSLGAPRTQTATVAAPSPQQPAASVEPESAGAQMDSSSPIGIPAAQVAQLAADVVGDDPKKRSAAITALADVPKARAIPVLQDVLTSGERETDRPLALRALRALAEHQGDADGSIRDALRHAMYHSDDDATTRGAQAALSDIENSLATPARRAK